MLSSIKSTDFSEHVPYCVSRHNGICLVRLTHQLTYWLHKWSCSGWLTLRLWEANIVAGLLAEESILAQQARVGVLVVGAADGPVPRGALGHALHDLQREQRPLVGQRAAERAQHFGHGRLWHGSVRFSLVIAHGLASSVSWWVAPGTKWDVRNYSRRVQRQ